MSGKIESRLMIVDDEADLVEELSEYFSQTQLYVDAYYVSTKALERIKWPPLINFALIDLRMPDIDGLSLIREIRKSQHSRCRIIAISGHATEMDMKNAFIEGADGFLAKPFSFERVTDMLFSGHDENAASSR